MAKLEPPLLARASVALLLLLSLFFLIVGVATPYWGILSINYLSLPVVSQEFHYLGLWSGLERPALSYLAAHQRAAQAFAVLSLIFSVLSLSLYAALCFASRRRPAWLSQNLAARLPLITLVSIAATALLQLLLWSLMAGLYNRWHQTVESAAGPAIQTFSLLGFSFALALMADIGQLAALPAVLAVIKLDGAGQEAAWSNSRTSTSPNTGAAAASTGPGEPTTTRIDELAAAAAGSGGNVRLHRQRPPPPPPLPRLSTIGSKPIRVVSAAAASPASAAQMDIDVDQEVAAAAPHPSASVEASHADDHSVENELMLERLHQLTVSGDATFRAEVSSVTDEPPADEV